MPAFIRNVLGVILGLVIGGAVNMSLIILSGKVIPPPEGVDVTKIEELKASMHLFEPKHFIFPFLAHALGTFVGAYITARIAKTSKMLMAMVVGLLFFFAGIVNVMQLPSPLWFNVLDLVVAYLPMAYLAGKLGSR
ncbi:hypothetical protein [Polluticoccus soli]|uniref:hypothetical protein n=1 Tax=Polluticoccus soli TaxID=3034150 RepID=UPI0023E2A0A1|nr:hypothetical protein [Flavipsychrobacter sp. JY13-12]